MGARDYWQQYFLEHHGRFESDGPAKSLGYSNERVQVQTYAHLLEGLGELNRKSVLDVGCGWGNFSLMCHACGSDVVGIDIIPETITTLRQKYPFITWQVADVTRRDDLDSLPLFERVVAVEVLQCLEFDRVIAALWSHVRPGGRLVASVPNSACPIVEDVTRRFAGALTPISEKEIRQLASTLPNVEEIWMKSLTFNHDQHWLPYSASAWGQGVVGAPNRIMFALVRSGEGDS